MKWAVLLLFLTIAPASGQHGPVPAGPPRVYTTSPVSASEAQQWRADLQHLVRGLEHIHPAPYHRTPREVFARAVAQLDQRIPRLAAHEIIVELERLLALVGDGHTNLNLAAAAGVDFHQLPVRFGVYEDGIYIEGADRAYTASVGGRVLAIGGVPADSALARLVPLISRDNDQWIQAAAPHLLNLVEVLHALRLTDRLDRVALRVEKDGRTSDVVMTPLEATRPRPFGYPIEPRYTNDWVDARDGSPPPLYRSDLGHPFGYRFLPDRRLLYIRWDQVQNGPGNTTALAGFREAMKLARDSAQRIDRVLLDLRNNTGGEGGLLDPVVREIVRTREVDEPGRFFVAIGPRTFSAALLFSVQLQRYARPIFVGEPTGGKVNVYAGHEFVTLPNSGIGVAVSPALYQTTYAHDVRPFVAPQLYVRPSFDDYRNNRDPVLDAVLHYRTDSFAGIESLVVAGDTLAAEREARRLGANPLYRYDPVTTPINALGYRLLRGGQTEAALRAFRLNVRVHPDYTNGWDSLGEAYADAGQVEAAIAAFERVLAREPNNDRAREFLARLRHTR